MEVTKHKNANLNNITEETYTFYFTKDNKEQFLITFSGNLDLYWMPINGNEFLITKENIHLYEIFNNLLNNINKVNRDNSPKEFNKIKWISDDDPVDKANILTLEKINSDCIKINFTKNETNYNKSIRIRNSGSRYDGYNVPFMLMYKDLIKYEPTNQIHIEEYIYQRKREK